MLNVLEADINLKMQDLNLLNEEVLVKASYEP
jgi:hypothetical protein